MTKEKWEKIYKVIKWILFIGWGAASAYAASTKSEQPWQDMYAISCILLMLHNMP